MYCLKCKTPYNLWTALIHEDDYLNDDFLCPDCSKKQEKEEKIAGAVVVPKVVPIVPNTARGQYLPDVGEYITGYIAQYMPSQWHPTTTGSTTQSTTQYYIRYLGEYWIADSEGIYRRHR